MSKPKIVASNIDWNGNVIERPSIKGGKCKFPFLYNDEMYNACVPGKLGWWCATSLNKESREVKKLGFCNIPENEQHRLTALEKKNGKKSSSNSH